MNRRSLLGLLLALPPCGSTELFSRRTGSRRDRGRSGIKHQTSIPILPFTLSAALSTTGAGRWRTNLGPWHRGALVPEPLARGGNVWQHRIWIDTEPSSSRIKIASRSRPEGSPTGWGSWLVDTAAASLNDGSIRNDAHLSAVMGVDKYGVPHVAWSAHGDSRPWHYHCGNSAGDTHVDSNGRTSGAFGGFNVPDARGANYNVFGGNFSYPKFFNTPDGELYFTGRIGAAGANAQQQFWHWATSAEGVGAWVQVGGDIIDWSGGAEDESPYMQTVAVNASGRIGVSWTWARRSSTKYYHDIYYMYSDDGGANWKDVAGGAVTLPAGNDAALLALSVPENNGLAVHHGLALRPDGTPVIACDYAGSPPATDLYVVTRVDGAWVRRTVGRHSAYWNFIDADGGLDPGAANSEYAQVGRAGVMVTATDTHVYYRSNYERGSAGLPALMVRSCFNADCLTWGGPYVLGDMPLGDAQPRHDINAWDFYGQASFPIQLLDESNQFGNALSTSVYVADATLPTQ